LPALVPGASTPPAVDARANEPTLATVPAPIEPRTLDQVVQAARVLVRDGFTRMEVQLDPPTLGTLRVTADAGTNGVRLTIAAEQPETRALLLQALPAIQSALAGGGLTAAVAVAQSFDQPDGRRAPARRETDREPRPDHSFTDRRRGRGPSRAAAAVDIVV
jgi:flagellar hook-length control protein FliK